MRTTVSVLGIGLLLCARVNAQACLGDCNGNGSVSAGELTKIIAIIGLCDSMATGCGAVAGGCVNADKNGNGIISAGELTNIISNILNFPSGCPPGGATPTATIPSAGSTNTPVPTHTPVPTNTQPAATPTPTATPLSLAVCGNGVKDGDEDCDDGGICIGGSNAGSACTSETFCQGNGVCDSGPHIGTSCANDAACGSARCVHCKTFGGDGCAANCTFEANIVFNLVPGVQEKECDSGPNAGMVCANPTPCAAVGAKCNPAIKAGTSGAFVHDGIIQLPLALNGSNVVTAGRLRPGTGGIVPFIVKAATVKLPAIKVGALACAFVRGIPPKTCGGTLFDADGVTFTTNCTPDYTAGASLCAGKNPCAFVNGDGNSGAGLFGCNGLDGVNLSFSQLSSLTLTVPPPTPPVGSGPPIITLSGTGPPGSVIVINSTAIGTTTASHAPGDVCTGVPPQGKTDCTGTDFGKDCKFGTDDDPQSARGTAAPLPQVSGTATGLITMSSASPQTDHNIGPFTVTGAPIDCAKLSSLPPSISGETIVGAFTTLNAPATNDIVVTNVFIAQ